MGTQTKQREAEIIPPISESEIEEIESRGWHFQKTSDGWTAENIKFMRKTEPAPRIKEAVEQLLKIEFEAERGDARAEPDLKSLTYGELLELESRLLSEPEKGDGWHDRLFNVRAAINLRVGQEAEAGRGAHVDASVAEGGEVIKAARGSKEETHDP